MRREEVERAIIEIEEWREWFAELVRRGDLLEEIGAEDLHDSEEAAQRYQRLVLETLLVLEAIRVRRVAQQPQICLTVDFAEIHETFLQVLVQLEFPTTG